MSSVVLISVIIILLSALVCYAFIAQTVKTKREEKQRKTLMLKKRKNTFMFMLNGFPAGFLPTEMALLVQNSLIDTLEQLNILEPSNATHAQDLQVVTQKMIDANKNNGDETRVQMESHQQIKEVKLCLQELNRFLHIQEKLNELSSSRSDHLQTQIKQLVVDITIDGYELSGKTALESGKTQLAHHYYKLALSLLDRESKHTFKHKQAQQYRNTIKKLAKQLQEEEKQKAAEAATPTKQKPEPQEMNNEGEWEDFEKGHASWKKNTVYD